MSLFPFMRGFSLLVFCLLVQYGPIQAQGLGDNASAAIRIQFLSEWAGLPLEFEDKDKRAQLVGLQFDLEEGWHFYWAGLSTEKLEPTLIWDLPEGFQLRALDHPEPALYDYGGFEGNGYSGQVLFLYELIAPDNFKDQGYSIGDHISLSVQVEWVLCKNECILGSQELSIDWPLVATPTLSDASVRLTQARQSAQASAQEEDKWESNGQNLERALIKWGVFGWLLAAFLGGLILNLMPCVLPVLSIKLFSLMEQIESGASAHRQQAFFYTAGTVCSFVLLAGLLFILRGLGEQVGWGFQLQDPYFITALIALFFLLGLNFFGVFELGTTLTRWAQAVPTSNTSSSLTSFFTGVLAAVAGAPCVGPFIGGVSGLALQLETGLGLLLFATMGLGMAFPFLLFAYLPKAAQLLPVPGAWMELFRQLMAWLLMATTGFFLWVVGESAGTDALVLGMLLLWLLGIAGWIFGRWGAITQALSVRRWAAVIALALILSAILGIGIAMSRLYRSASEEGSLHKSTGFVTNEQALDSSRWEAWSPPAVDAAIAAGAGVFIDFTASWCLICQRNKFFILNSKKADVLFRKYGIRLFTADWTHNDPVITEALEAYGRSGVPLYILITPEGEERILPQNLSISLLRSALEEAFIEREQRAFE